MLNTRQIVLAAFLLPSVVAQAWAGNLPNIVVILIDDMGYADIGPFGADAYETPNLDRMAAEGRVLTDFHSASAVCSAARAALLTGCYPDRVGIPSVLFPDSEEGINSEETTIAELCRSKGYATAVFGKWHLGHHHEFLPLQHGFDEFFGLPYSNDMWPYKPGETSLEAGVRMVGKNRGPYPPLPLFDGNEICDAEISPDEHAQLTTQYTRRAVDFIDRNAERPFLLYLPHSMVHVPLFVSEKFSGKSGAGLFGDVVMEIDWSVGEIMTALEEHGITEETLILFTSDNGPWLNFGTHAGSAKPLREGKITMFEGGCRVPCIARWPGKIPAGTTCDELSTTMDLLPTIAKLIGAELPARKVDGHDISGLLFKEPCVRSPYEIFYCYSNGELHAVRDRRWKLHLPHSYPTLGRKPGGTDGRSVEYDQEEIGLALFDLKMDVAETTNLVHKHHDVVGRLMVHAETARDTLGDKRTGRIGNENRFAGSITIEE